MDEDVSEALRDTRDFSEDMQREWRGDRLMPAAPQSKCQLHIEVFRAIGSGVAPKPGSWKLCACHCHFFPPQLGCEHSFKAALPGWGRWGPEEQLRHENNFQVHSTGAAPLCLKLFLPHSQGAGGWKKQQECRCISQLRGSGGGTRKGVAHQIGTRLYLLVA